MPKTFFEDIVFTLMMVFVMVYAMICYNISLEIGGMSNQVFLLAFRELVIMGPVAFLLEFLFAGRVAKGMAFRFVNPQTDRPIVLILAISAMTVCVMCPLMSFAATLLFKHPGKEIVAVWIETTVKNFPMAFFWQIFFAGPIVRRIFGLIFNSKKSAEAEKEKAVA